MPHSTHHGQQLHDHGHGIDDVTLSTPRLAPPSGIVIRLPLGPLAGLTGLRVAPPPSVKLRRAGVGSSFPA